VGSSISHWSSEKCWADILLNQLHGLESYDCGQLRNKALPMTNATTFASVFLLLLPSMAATAQPASVPAANEDQRLLTYIKPGQLIDVGGRRINLHCMGTGAPTVILMSGLSSWSPNWYKVQPDIAKWTRVCTFDRAGYGFSDPAPRPQILSDVVDDLHKALKAGAMTGPLVLVGHSLGGVETRLYTQRWPEDVVGMVLDDTSPAAERLIDESQPDFDEVIGLERFASKKLFCALLAAHGPLDPSKPEFAECSLRLPRDTPAEFRKRAPEFFTAAYFVAQVSLMSSLSVHTYDSVDHRSLGAMPLVVLSAENSWETWNENTPAIVRFNRSYLPAWIGMHDELARLSSRGVHRIIKGSGHEIQLQKPQAVIDAVTEVLGQLRSDGDATTKQIKSP
jgi:pimeloyl-ACP methyl ester carboxylesterase